MVIPTKPQSDSIVLISAEKVAEKLDSSVKFARHLMDSGKLPKVWLSRKCVRTTLSALNEFIKRRTITSKGAARLIEPFGQLKTGPCLLARKFRKREIPVSTNKQVKLVKITQKKDNKPDECKPIPRALAKRRFAKLKRTLARLRSEAE